MLCKSTSCLNNKGGNCFKNKEVSIDMFGSCADRFTESDMENQEFSRICKMGYSDCVMNPLYIAIYHYKWWEDMGSRTTCKSCKNGSEYDDEDK